MTINLTPEKIANLRRWADEQPTVLMASELLLALCDAACWERRGEHNGMPGTEYIFPKLGKFGGRYFSLDTPIELEPRAGGITWVPGDKKDEAGW